MLLYLYLNPKRGLEALRNEELFAAKPTSFNDPFELAFALDGKVTLKDCEEMVLERLNSPELRSQLEAGGVPLSRAVQNSRHTAAQLEAELNNCTFSTFEPIVKKTVEELLRVICFCNADTISSSDDVLMWSHYASKHEGIRLTLAIPDDEILPGKLYKVDYKSVRISVDRRMTFMNTVPHDRYADTITQKSDSWKYEQEVRLLISPNACKSRWGLRGIREFFPIKKMWIQQIDIGLRASQKYIKKITDVVIVKGLSEKVRYAKLHATKYSLIYVNDPKLP